MKKSANSIFVALFAGVALSALAACSHDVENRGYVTKSADFSKIKPGVTTKSDVLQQFGSPTTTSIYGDETWFYIGKEQTKETFYNPKVKSYNGFAISFNDKGTVSGVNEKTQDNLKDVDVEKEYTKTSGNEITVWQQLFGNLGKFNPAARQNRGPNAGGTGMPGR